ncbi:MAG: vitamin K epoxide reductase family protein [Kofleriaceae bacterium]
MRPPTWLVVVLVGAVLGLVFAGVSTYDFIEHLDRQVHSLHCSFIPGVTHTDPTSGCQVAMMSPYSSLFRTHVWGGIPIALGAMSVFAFIAFAAADLIVTRRKDDVKATLFLVTATALPLVISLVMLTISLTKLGTTCKLCVCIYLASALVFTGALMTWRRARRGAIVGTSRSGGHRLEVGVANEPASNAFFAGMFGLGCVFVALPIVLYLATAPDNSKFIGTCDALVKPDDTYGVMVDVHRTSSRNAQAVEILDPLCPACKAFEQRLEASGLDDKLDRRAILFPLDNTCNWMISETTHPGACTVSEAVLCAGARAPEVLQWAFENQDQIRADTAKDPAAAARYVKQRFPELASCVGSPAARSRLNKSLRWAVANNIHVLTPQLFVDGTKLCDEDVDLGLEFALSIMLDRHDHGTLAPKPLPAAAAPPATAPVPAKPRASESPTTGSTEKPAADKPAAEPTGKPAPAPADKPAVVPAADKPVVEPAADKPAADKPAADKPGVEPAAGKPAAQKPAGEPADKPVTSPDPGSAP